MNQIEQSKLIITLRKQLKELTTKCNALEQENALLNHEMSKSKRPLKRLSKTSPLITIL